ncbi:hypothetical protein HMPREF0658_2323 [Hoylesella marshii DSM 16973 = JCM 13450]|uniref:Uncharacterized protein n=1 Tax=Hoylesella marshii DSM 16973 = JCM 13450 TaxID=862515 RepID=E0NVW7_9BACT|nr:hypothetical protein HMPREF0658_2323 [Hoylesella marshii DSM 16973 = JCM 13450]
MNTEKDSDSSSSRIPHRFNNTEYILYYLSIVSLHFKELI